MPFEIDDEYFDDQHSDQFLTWCILYSEPEFNYQHFRDHPIAKQFLKEILTKEPAQRLGKYLIQICRYMHIHDFTYTYVPFSAKVLAPMDWIISKIINFSSKFLLTACSRHSRINNMPISLSAPSLAISTGSTSTTSSTPCSENCQLNGMMMCPLYCIHGTLSARLSLETVICRRHFVRPKSNGNTFTDSTVILVQATILCPCICQLQRNE